MKQFKKKLRISIGFLFAFALWTAAVRLVDVRPIGPQNSLVGFAFLNQVVHDLTGVHLTLYRITDWLGLIPVLICLGFGTLGLIQWVRRKRLRSVDFGLLLLGGLYLVTMSAYVFFEAVPVNYRPVLIEGILEPSYPSSTTLLVLCVMPTAAIELRARLKDGSQRRWSTAAISVFTAFMVIGRLISGVHWVTDIVGSMLLSAGLVLLYYTARTQLIP